jgi:hypothetical protein
LIEDALKIVRPHPRILRLQKKFCDATKANPFRGFPTELVPQLAKAWDIPYPAI